jgi:hypothetical protein
LKKKPWILITYNKFKTFIRNSKINIMRSLGYGCENCKHCDPVCYFAGEISGKDFWCKDWEYNSKF